MITIVNYGLGNVGAFANMYGRLNLPFKIATKCSDLNGATHLIIPGVGAFDHAMELLGKSGFLDPLNELVLGNRIPTLGVCVGMQVLGDHSDEGSSGGLGWIGGRIRAFASSAAADKLPMPHMGWNDVRPTRTGIPLFNGLEENARFYFLHSYYFECTSSGDVAAQSDYGIQFASVVHHGNICGVQFHPEKSHHWGAMLLRNFAEQL